MKVKSPLIGLLCSEVYTYVCPYRSLLQPPGIREVINKMIGK